MLKRLAPILSLTALCWLAFLLNNIILGGQLTQYAIRPRHLSSLPGILVFVSIVLIGWVMRRVLDHYHLLQVPRKAVLT